MSENLSENLSENSYEKNKKQLERYFQTNLFKACKNNGKLDLLKQGKEGYDLSILIFDHVDIVKGAWVKPGTRTDNRKGPDGIFSNNICDQLYDWFVNNGITPDYDLKDKFMRFIFEDSNSEYFYYDDNNERCFRGLRCRTFVEKDSNKEVTEIVFRCNLFTGKFITYVARVYIRGSLQIYDSRQF